MKYRWGLRNPTLHYAGSVFYHERIRALGYEVEIMQAEGEQGEQLARMWVLIACL